MYGYYGDYREYKVEFSYKLATGKRRTEHDTTYAGSPQEAVNRIRDWYGDLVAMRVEYVYADGGRTWDLRDDWE